MGLHAIKHDQAHVTWIPQRICGHYPTQSIDLIADAFAQSLKPNTLAAYISHVSCCERLMGSTLDTWAPFDDWLYRDLALSLMHSKLAGSSISAYFSAVGTFVEMLGHSCPNQAWISYIIKGLSMTMALPEKISSSSFSVCQGSGSC